MIQIRSARLGRSKATCVRSPLNGEEQRSRSREQFQYVTMRVFAKFGFLAGHALQTPQTRRECRISSVAGRKSGNLTGALMA